MAKLLLKRGGRIDPALIVLGVLLLTIAVGALLVSTVGRNFFSSGNIRDILTGMSVLGLVAIGQTVVILAGSLDLSVPYVISLASLIAATTMAGRVDRIAAGVALSLMTVALIGLAIGLIVAYLKVSGFIATLGVGLIVRGYLDTNFKGTAGQTPWEFQLLGASGIGPIPVSTILMVLLMALTWFLISRTRTGHHLYAVGGNLTVARFSGVNTARPLVVAHIVCALTAGLAGLLLASRLGVGSPTVGTQGGYDLLSIAAVVIGGTLLTGGRGNIWGTLGGVAIFAVIDNVMSVMQINPFLKDVVRGVVIIVAVALYTRRTVALRRPRFIKGATS